jgi:Holliday junction resolvase RusA-like endonuclease
MTQTLVLDNFPPVVRKLNKKTGKVTSRVSNLSPNARVHWRTRKAAKEDVQSTVAIFARTQNLQPIAPPVLVFPTFIVPDRRARDGDNYNAMLKAVLDALVKAGVLFRDDWRNLTLQPAAFDYEKGVRRLELRLEAA